MTNAAQMRRDVARSRRKRSMSLSPNSGAVDVDGEKLAFAGREPKLDQFVEVIGSSRTAGRIRGRPSFPVASVRVVGIPTPMQGFCAEGGEAIALFGATWLGIPVSTTHTITGSIVGVGSARRVSAVRWGIARGIVIAWGITLPAAAAVAAGCYWAAGSSPVKRC